MYLVQKNHLRGLQQREYQLLRQLTRLSKNLYNQTLFILRQNYFANGSFLPYESSYHLLKENETYHQLPSQVAQQTMRVVNRAIQSFFGLLRERKKGNYTRPIRMPHYLPKDGFFMCIFPKDMFKVEGETIRLSLGRYFTKELGTRYLRYKLPPHVRGKLLKEVRLLPRQNGLFFEIEYVYVVDPELPNLNPSKCMAIDLGVNNFTTCVSTDGTTFIIEGKGLKSYNRWWNKQKARLQAIYAKQGIKFGKKLAWFLQKRNHVMNNYMAQAVHQIIQECLNHKIGKLTIGELKDIKQHLKLGKKTNQHFHYIPFGVFKQKLRAKCWYYGITFLEVEEAYTSQTCSSCGLRNKRNRKYRGLYVCSACGTVLNADVNGAINILKKVASESDRIGSSGRVSRPVRIRLPGVLGQHPSHEALSVRAG